MATATPNGRGARATPAAMPLADRPNTGPAPDLVVQLDGGGTASWQEFRGGALVAWEVGWRDDADLLVIAPTAVPGNLLGGGPVRFRDVLAVAAEGGEPIAALPPFDLDEGVPLVDCPLATLRVGYELTRAPLHAVHVEEHVERGHLVRRVLAEDHGGPDGDHDVHLSLPYDAYLQLRAGVVDIADVVPSCALVGHPSYVHLLVALLDADGYRRPLLGRRCTALALLAWFAHLRALPTSPDASGPTR